MKHAFIVLSALLLTPLAGLSAAAPSKPNIIFILSDDQRYNSLGMTGHPVTQTPYLDELAKEGVFFSNAHITSPICGPSRANFWTGQWERKNRIGFDYVSHHFVSEASFQDSWLMQLKKAGYSTAFIGKHHTKIGDRGNTPLKENMDFCYYQEGHLGFHLDRHKVFSNLKHKTQIEGLFEATSAFLTQGRETDYFFENVDKSVKNCLKRRDPQKPFCAWVNFNLPHAASIGTMGERPEDPEFYSTLYSDQAAEFSFPEGYPLPVTLPAEVFSKSDLMPYYRHDNRKALLGTKMKMARANHAIDQFVGNLRQLLVELGEDQNTIIVFTSDNGLYLGEHGIGGKSLIYEEATHVPLIVYSPFLPEAARGKQRDELVVGQDVSATLIDLCGLEVPDAYQGVSLRSLIEGKSVPWREEIFLENLFTDQGYPRAEAVRSKEYKYVRYFSREKDRKQYLPEASINGEAPIHEELFYLKTDPTEQHNLAQQPDHADMLETLRTRCQELVTQLAK